MTVLRSGAKIVSQFSNEKFAGVEENLLRKLPNVYWENLFNKIFKMCI